MQHSWAGFSRVSGRSFSSTLPEGRREVIHLEPPGSQAIAPAAAPPPGSLVAQGAKGRRQQSSLVVKDAAEQDRRPEFLRANSENEDPSLEQLPTSSSWFPS